MEEMKGMEEEKIGNLWFKQWRDGAEGGGKRVADGRGYIRR